MAFRALSRWVIVMSKETSRGQTGSVQTVGTGDLGETTGDDPVSGGELPYFKGLPNCGAYRVIVADPPWRFDVRDRATGLGRSADQHYATMMLPEIKALPLNEIAAPNCWLMLWTTGSHLPQAFEVMDAWGFKYSSLGFVWVKLRSGYRRNMLGIQPSDIAMGMGFTTRKSTEPCLLARRGNPKRLSRNVRDVIHAPVREHSRKPDEFYERVERFAAGPYLDLFARERREGRDVWGNQLDKFESRCRSNQLELKLQTGEAR
jgi:N6-adenosine-specific RNA methylase IME4